MDRKQGRIRVKNKKTTLPICLAFNKFWRCFAYFYSDRDQLHLYVFYVLSCPSFINFKQSYQSVFHAFANKEPKSGYAAKVNNKLTSCQKLTSSQARS